MLGLAGAVIPLPGLAGEPPPLLVAERYRDNIDVSRYWVSEKLNGVRAIWDGKFSFAAAIRFPLRSG